MKITVVALGKIGLPLAVQYAFKGHEVLGSDIDETVVAAVNAGTAPFPGEHDLDRLLTEVVEDGRLTATTDITAAVAQSDAVVVVVPLSVDSEEIPDFGPLDAATRAIGSGLHRGTLVSYETTLPVGTTRNRFLPKLQDLSGLRAGGDFQLVFSPERVLTGRVFRDLRRYPKLLGGVDAESAERGTAFYEAVLDFDELPDSGRPNGVWDLGSAEAAELAKLAETTYRDVNIGLANQFARFAENNGIDIYQVIAASNSQPFSHIHQPGIAVGGHCIPVYPRLYLWNDPSATVVRSARQANAEMPAHVVDLLKVAHGDLEGARVVVLGVAYRGGVKETAFSGVFPTVAALHAKGAKVEVHDPLFSDDEIKALGFAPYALGQPADAVVLHTDHEMYRNLTKADFPGVRTLVDGRNLTNPAHWDGVRRRVIGVDTDRGIA